MSNQVYYCDSDSDSDSDDMSVEFEFDDPNDDEPYDSGTDAHVADYNEYMNSSVHDTTAAQARKGRDIQGIPWGKLNILRKNFRITRLGQYKNYENIPHSGDGLEKDCKNTDKVGSFYAFRRSSRSVTPTILHFQLRNLIWAASKHDVYLVSDSSVLHWSSLTQNKTEVLDVSGHVTPCETHHENLMEGFTNIQVSTIAVKDNLLLVGGFQGELICKYLDRPGVSYCMKLATEDNAITNSIDIFPSDSGAVHFIVSNNDCGVREFDVETFQQCRHFCYPWPVNHISLSPDGKVIIIVGDNINGMLVDSKSGKEIAELIGHVDYSFSAAWHPNGLTFATGNQDRTCRIWDIRNLSKPVTALRGKIGAIRSIRYTGDGKFMAMSEGADYVHIYDVESGYQKEQEIDFFGEISGLSFSPDTESLFFGVWDRTFGSLMEFSRCREYSYLDTM